MTSLRPSSYPRAGLPDHRDDIGFDPDLQGDVRFDVVSRQKLKPRPHVLFESLQLGLHDVRPGLQLGAL